VRADGDDVQERIAEYRRIGAFGGCLENLTSKARSRGKF
jgi:hypothetical protein